MYPGRLLMLVAAVLAGGSIAVNAQETELKTPSPIGLLPNVYFEDEFEGDRLANHWQITNPDPDQYIVEGGALTIIAKAVGGIEEETTPNLFRLEKDFPKGDWSITLKLNAELQTAREWLQFGLFTDTGNYVLASLFTNSGCCGYFSNLTIRTRKKSGDKMTQFHKKVWHRDTEDFSSVADTIQQPMILKLIKEGRIYRTAVHFHGQMNAGGEPTWIETDRLTLLRAPKQFVLQASQWEDVKGESWFSIDSVAIETPSSE